MSERAKPIEISVVVPAGRLRFQMRCARAVSDPGVILGKSLITSAAPALSFDANTNSFASFKELYNSRSKIPFPELALSECFTRPSSLPIPTVWFTYGALGLYKSLLMAMLYFTFKY